MLLTETYTESKYKYFLASGYLASIYCIFVHLSYFIAEIFKYNYHVKLMKNSSKKTNDLLIYLCLTFLVMGASIHLVGDSINHRLSLIGYELHLSVEDNPIMKQLKPKELIKSFELLYFYDEVLGHYMW